MNPVFDLKGQLIGHQNDADEFIPLPAKDISQVTLSIDNSSGPTPHTPQTKTVPTYIDSSNAKDHQCGFLSLDLPLKTNDLVPAKTLSLVTCEKPFAGSPALPPIPEGDFLFDLIDEVATTVEHVFDNMKFAGMSRLHGDLRVSDGMHSTVLMDGVTKWGSSKGHGGVRQWIVEGTLRSTDELTPALQRFIAMMQRKQRLRQIEPDWKFDSWGMQVVGSMFGLPAPLPLDEIAKRDAEHVAEYEERRRLDAEDSRKMKAELAAQEEKDKIEDRIRDLLRRIAIAFHQLGDADGELNMSGDTVPEAYHVVMRHRKNVKKFSEALVRSLVEQGREDTQIMEYIEEFSRLSIGEWGSSVPDPLGPQDIRYWFTLDEFKAFYADSERVNSLLDRYDITSLLGMDGRWVVTLTPRREDV